MSPLPTLCRTRSDCSARLDERRAWRGQGFAGPKSARHDETNTRPRASDRLGRVAVRVGIITNKEDSPQLFLDRVKGELYYAFAETDRSVPPHIPDEPKGLLEKHGIKHELKVVPGTEHGVAFPERAIDNTFAAEETWDKMFAMWDRTLK